MSLTAVGKHLVRHGDLMVGFDELAARLPPVDWVYSDPPWGDGNLKFWRTMNRKMTGTEAVGDPPTVSAFLAEFFRVVRAACKDTAVVFVEYGLRWQDLLRETAAAVGLSVAAVTNPRYGSANTKLALFTLAWRSLSIPDTYVRAVAATKGFNTLLAATAPFPLAAGQVILDPCCGLGYTARLAVRHGMTFYGNELNAARLASTVKILQSDPAK